MVHTASKVLLVMLLAALPAAAEAPPQLVQTRVNASILAPSFDATAASLNGLITQHNGRVSNLSLDSNSSTGSAYLKLPPARLDSFLKELPKLGTVESQNLSTSDNTRGYFDTEARLKAFEQLARVDVKSLLASADMSPEERLAVRAEFDNYVRSQIQSCRSSLQTYQDYQNWVEVSLSFRKPQQAESQGQPHQHETSPEQPLPAPAGTSQGSQLMPVYALVLFNLLGLWAVHRRLER